MRCKLILTSLNSIDINFTVCAPLFPSSSYLDHRDGIERIIFLCLCQAPEYFLSTKNPLYLGKEPWLVYDGEGLQVLLLESATIVFVATFVF